MAELLGKLLGIIIFVIYWIVWIFMLIVSFAIIFYGITELLDGKLFLGIIWIIGGFLIHPSVYLKYKGGGGSFDGGCGGGCGGCGGCGG